MNYVKVLCGILCNLCVCNYQVHHLYSVFNIPSPGCRFRDGGLDRQAGNFLHYHSQLKNSNRDTFVMKIITNI